MWLDTFLERDDEIVERLAQKILQATMPDTRILFDILPQLSKLLPKVPGFLPSFQVGHHLELK